MKERGILRHLIQSGEIDQARTFLQEKFRSLFDTSQALRALLDTLEYVSFLQDGELERAIEMSSRLSEHSETEVPSRSREGRRKKATIGEFIALLCYEDPG